MTVVFDSFCKNKIFPVLFLILPLHFKHIWLWLKEKNLWRPICLPLWLKSFRNYLPNRFAMGHSSVKVTETYFKRHTDERIGQMNREILSQVFCAWSLGAFLMPLGGSVPQLGDNRIIRLWFGERRLFYVSGKMCRYGYFVGNGERRFLGLFFLSPGMKKSSFNETSLQEAVCQ